MELGQFTVQDESYFDLKSEKISLSLPMIVL